MNMPLPAAAAVLARLDAALESLPLIAILRGLRGGEAEEAEDIVQALFDAGFRIAEVPLNSPNAFDTIARLVKRFGEQMVIGAGTVTDVDSVLRLAETGAQLCVAPNTDAAVIRAAIANGLAMVPGYMSPSEAFAAVAAGARHLKLFPAAGRESDLAALRAVLPRDVKLVAVGGARPADLQALLAAGADAAGIGSDLYRPGDSADKVGQRARVWSAAVKTTRSAPVAELCWNPNATIGEGPVHRPGSGVVTWVDPVRRRLLSWNSKTRHSHELSLHEPVYSLALLPTGELVGALDDGLAVVNERSGAIERLPPALLDAGCRFNDMTVDSRGGLWVGSMHKGLLATRGAIHYAPSIGAPLRRVARGLGVPNGMAFDADERTLFMIDTLSRHLLAFPIDVKPAQLGEPVIVTDFLDLPGKPDGLTIAPDGSLWVAMWGGSCVLRVGRNGAIEQKLRIPALHVSSVCFGSDCGSSELWVTTSRARQIDEQLAATPGAGGLFRIKLASV